MMHNPFQSYQTDPTLAAYAGITNPLATMQTINPITSVLGGSSPFGSLSQLGQTGFPGTSGQQGLNPQQLQLASLLASQASIPQMFGQSHLGQNPYNLGQNPWITGGLQNPLQNPLLTAGLQNPLLTAGLQNPLLTAGLQNPLLTAGLQNPLLTAGLQNPLLNPWLQQQFGLQPFQHSHHQQFGQGLQQFGQTPYGQTSPYGQIGSPYGQQGLPFGLLQTLQQQQPLQAYSPYQQFGHGGSPFQQQLGQPYGQIGSPLLPQSWIGQGGQFGAGGQGIGQIHPLIAQQLAARAFQSPGMTPWGF